MAESGGADAAAHDGADAFGLLARQEGLADEARDEGRHVCCVCGGGGGMLGMLEDSVIAGCAIDVVLESVSALR